MPEPETPPSAADDLSLLRAAAEEAGRIALHYFGKSPEVWMKGGTSPVSEADYAADRYLRETLLAARPDYGWLSEETTDDPARLGARRTFVVDPIDGTRGFLEGSRRWCVSVAVVEAGRPVAGVIEAPARGETYWAVAGAGAFRDGGPIAVRTPGANPELAGSKHFFDALPERFRERVSRVGYVPSLAYRIAMIAGAEIDGTFVRPGAHDWDLAAAALILSEAGGKLTDAQGVAPLFAGPEIRHGVLVAGGVPLADELADAVRQAGA